MGSLRSRPHLRHVNGAHVRARTGDLVLTKDVLCQLSYVGARRFCGKGEMTGNHMPILANLGIGSLPVGRWWAGRESNPHSRRRLIYSQRSSPPAQPTHAFDRQVVRCRPSGSIAKGRSVGLSAPRRPPRPCTLDPETGSVRRPTAHGQRFSPLTHRQRLASGRICVVHERARMLRSWRCRIRIAYSRLPATRAERQSASASSGIGGRLRGSDHCRQSRNGHGRGGTGNGADGGSRTHNRRFTKPLLYR